MEEESSTQRRSRKEKVGAGKKRARQEDSVPDQAAGPAKKPKVVQSKPQAVQSKFKKPQSKPQRTGSASSESDILASLFSPEKIEQFKQATATAAAAAAAAPKPVPVETTSSLPTKALKTKGAVGKPSTASEEAESATGARQKQKHVKDSKEKTDRTVFVGNVPIGYLKEPKKLTVIFKQYGEIDTFRFRSVPVTGTPIPKYDAGLLKKASIIKGAVPETGSMNAYILYKEQASVEKALEYDGYHIRVDRCQGSKTHKQEKNRSIFIGNLSFSATEEALRQFFVDHLDESAVIENVRIIRDRKTRQSKGIGYIVFESPESVDNALLLSGSEFEARELRISKAVPMKKGKAASTSDGASLFQGKLSTFANSDRIKQRIEKKMMKGKKKPVPKGTVPNKKPASKRFPSKK